MLPRICGGVAEGAGPNAVGTQEHLEGVEELRTANIL